MQRPVTKPTSELLGLDVQCGGGIGSLSVMITDVEADLAADRANGWLIISQEELLDTRAG